MTTVTLLDSRYELGIRIGRGGMAEVFQAWDRRLSREVAVKVLNTECSRDAGMLERFRQESHALAQLNHPNIVTLFDTGETAGRFYLVMERLQGQPFDGLLRELREHGDVLGWRQLVAFLRPVCAALQAAHGRQIVHRDIKPSNLFLHRPGGDVADTDAGLVKILDFGIAKMLAGAERRPGADLQTLTSRGLFIGTPHYSAPEAIEPQIFGPIGVGADIYALGVVMYHCLTGVLPFEGEPRASVIYKTAFEDPPALRKRAPERSIAPAVESVVLRALARRPEDRYLSVRTLLEAINSVPEEPTAPRAMVAARTVAGQIDSTTQVRPSRERSAAAPALAGKGPARPLRRSAPEFRPSALHTLAEPAQETRKPTAGGTALPGSNATAGVAAPPTSVVGEIPEAEPRAATAVAPPLPPTAWDAPPWLRASASAATPTFVMDAPDENSPVVLATRAQETRPRVETQPELRPLPEKNLSTRATIGIRPPLDIAETPLPGGTFESAEPNAPAPSRVMLFVGLILLAVIGAAWWFMPEAASLAESRRESPTRPAPRRPRNPQPSRSTRKRRRSRQQQSLHGGPLACPSIRTTVDSYISAECATTVGLVGPGTGR